MIVKASLSPVFPSPLPSSRTSPRQDENTVILQQPSLLTAPEQPVNSGLSAPAVGAIVGATVAISERLPLVNRFSVNPTLARFEYGSNFKWLSATGTLGSVLTMATLGAIAGIFYKGGNPFKNWQQSPSAPLEQKLFGGPPQLMDTQTLSDRQEIHNAKLRSAGWGILLGVNELNTIYRLFWQDPVKLAQQRRDVQTGQRSLQNAIQHEVTVRDAQLRVASVSMIPGIGGLASLLGLAVFEKPESSTFNSVI